MEYTGGKVARYLSGLGWLVGTGRLMFTIRSGTIWKVNNGYKNQMLSPD